MTKKKKNSWFIFDPEKVAIPAGFLILAIIFTWNVSAKMEERETEYKLEMQQLRSDFNRMAENMEKHIIDDDLHEPLAHKIEMWAQKKDVEDLKEDVDKLNLKSYHIEKKIDEQGTKLDILLDEIK